ncbi:MAG: RNA polymerase sigma factor [Draconibacterium sp.]
MDKDEFIGLVSTHRNLLFKVCNSYCADPELRRDLEQEILVQLWTTIGRYDGRVKISTWIYKIALNTAISFYRKSSKRIDKPGTNSSDIIIYSNPEYDSDLDDKIALLYKLIGQLSKMDKALMLLYLDNYKYTEISEVLGITESNVATKINRIKKRFKMQFNNY